ncbi:MAG: hypothetical protein CSA66_07995 [Proteobacteria bacterium]|nr:MAG: hypothetical protein CSA66_07995 [Pseudomonadota bacterium]
MPHRRPPPTLEVEEDELDLKRRPIARAEVAQVLLDLEAVGGVVVEVRGRLRITSRRGRHIVGVGVGVGVDVRGAVGVRPEGSAARRAAHQGQREDEG